MSKTGSIICPLLALSSSSALVPCAPPAVIAFTGPMLSSRSSSVTSMCCSVRLVASVWTMLARPISILLLIFSPSNQRWYLHTAPNRPRPTRSRPSSFSSPPVRFHSPRTLRRHRRLQFNSPASYNSLCLTNDNVGDGIFEKLRVAESRADEQVAGGTGCDAVGDWGLWKQQNRTFHILIGKRDNLAFW